MENPCVVKNQVRQVVGPEDPGLSGIIAGLRAASSRGQKYGAYRMVPGVTGRV
jgi:hypothetical protein